jgi:hypothetical protein
MNRRRLHRTRCALPRARSTALPAPRLTCAHGRPPRRAQPRPPLPHWPRRATLRSLSPQSDPRPVSNPASKRRRRPSCASRECTASHAAALQRAESPAEQEEPPPPACVPGCRLPAAYACRASACLTIVVAGRANEKFQGSVAALSAESFAHTLGRLDKAGRMLSRTMGGFQVRVCAACPCERGPVTSDGPSRRDRSPRRSCRTSTRTCLSWTASCCARRARSPL